MSNEESNIINFTTRERIPCSAPEPYREQPTTEKAPGPAYVKVRADVFHEMLDVIAFYASQHFDHGKRANVLLNRMAKK